MLKINVLYTVEMHLINRGICEKYLNKNTFHDVFLFAGPVISLDKCAIIWQLNNIAANIAAKLLAEIK